MGGTCPTYLQHRIASHFIAPDYFSNWLLSLSNVKNDSTWPWTQFAKYIDVLYFISSASFEKYGCSCHVQNMQQT